MHNISPAMAKGEKRVKKHTYIVIETAIIISHRALPANQTYVLIHQYIINLELDSKTHRALYERLSLKRE